MSPCCFWMHSFHLGLVVISISLLWETSILAKSVIGSLDKKDERQYVLLSKYSGIGRHEAGQGVLDKTE